MPLSCPGSPIDGFGALVDRHDQTRIVLEHEHVIRLRRQRLLRFGMLAECIDGPAFAS
jgi:hypothetical protein